MIRYSYPLLYSYPLWKMGVEPTLEEVLQWFPKYEDQQRVLDYVRRGFKPSEAATFVYQEQQMQMSPYVAPTPPVEKIEPPKAMKKVVQQAEKIRRAQQAQAASTPAPTTAASPDAPAVAPASLVAALSPQHLALAGAGLGALGLVSSLLMPRPLLGFARAPGLRGLLGRRVPIYGSRIPMMLALGLAPALALSAPYLISLIRQRLGGTS